MNLIEESNYALNSFMAFNVEVAANRTEDIVTIHDLSLELEVTRRSISTLTKVMKELQEIVFDVISQHEDVKDFVHDEAEELDDE